MDTIFFPSICMDYSGMLFTYGEVFLVGVLVGTLFTLVWCYYKKINFNGGIKKMVDWNGFGIRESKIFRHKRLYLTFTEKQFLGLLDALSGKEKLRAEYYEKIANLYFITIDKKKGVN